MTEMVDNLAPITHAIAEALDRLEEKDVFNLTIGGVQFKCLSWPACPRSTVYLIGKSSASRAESGRKKWADI